MAVEVYLLGIDFVIDHEGKILILEMQNIYTCNVPRAVELTGKDPLTRLKAAIAKQYPSQTIFDPIKERMFWPQYERVASIAPTHSPHGDIAYINRGIQAICDHKWLFYAICNAHPSLKDYIPPTQ